jgi:GNAT superfamily N-acetyltransferase
MRVTIREMTEHELRMAISWAEKEGWNPGRYDYRSYFAFDNKGFLLLLLDDKPVGCISIVRHSRTFAFIGLFIVKPEYRGKGYGKRLWNEALKRLADKQTVGLYSVPQQVSRYKRSGFFDGGFSNRRFQLAKSRKEDVSHLLDHDADSISAYHKLLKYDARIWGSSRESFLKSVLQQAESYAFISFDEKTGEINGYGVIRPCMVGYRVGPIYSDSPESAKTLTRVLLAQVPSDSQIIFDIPNTNTFSHMFATFFGLDRVKEVDTLAMFKGDIPNLKESKCYGTASLEIG